MTCPTTVFMGHETCQVSQHGALTPLQLAFETQHSQDVSLHLCAESSLDHDLQVSGSHHRLSKGNLRSPTRSWTAADVFFPHDSEDFHCEHFAVQIHLVGHHFSHTPNFEKQKSCEWQNFSDTHAHGSHKVHGQLIDRYEPTTIPSKLSSAFSSLLFCVYICGHQRRRRTASNSVNLFLFPCQPLASL